MKTNRNVVRLTESQLKAMIAESVNNVLNEIGDTNHGQYMLGRLAGRKNPKWYDGDTPEDKAIWDYASKNNMNGDFGEYWYVAGNIGDDADDIKRARYGYNFDDSDKSSFYDDNPEKTEKDNAREIMSKYIPKNVKDIIGNDKKYPDYAMMHGAFKPYHKVYYDKNGNSVNPYNESRLRKIVSESIDRILKNK